MPPERPWFRHQTGIDFSKLVTRPTAAQVVKQHLKRQGSQFPLRVLGWASDGNVTLAEEERTHTHVIGLPDSGKSKFLELLIRGDIDNLVSGRSKAGLCLVDSSDFGNTYYKVLKYCAKVGYEKVCLIDPNDFLAPGFGKFPVINPIRYDAPVSVITGTMLEMMRILWEGEDFSRTAKIQDYLSAVIALLHKSGSTLYDAKYFFSRKMDFYNYRRAALLSKIRNAQFDDNALTIEDIFGSSDSTFRNDFASTVRRLRPVLTVEPLNLMIGSNQSPLNFQKMLSDGWIILANLDPQIWDVPQQRFLGTLIINEIIHASYRLIQRGRNIPFYLYIDEVGRYATRTLADVMNYKRTSRIQLIMAHQDMTQIKNAEVLAAVRNARIKVMFYVERDDRDKLVRQMYGGEVPLDQVSYELSGLKKQEAVIKIGALPPRKTRLVDLPDIELSDKRLEAFKKKLYQQPWYKNKREIYDEINARFKPTARSIHPEQPGDSGVDRKSARRNKKVAVRPAPSDDGANRKARQPAPQRRPSKSVFSEEED